MILKAFCNYENLNDCLQQTGVGTTSLHKTDHIFVKTVIYV